MTAAPAAVRARLARRCRRCPESRRLRSAVRLSVADVRRGGGSGTGVLRLEPNLRPGASRRLREALRELSRAGDALVHAVLDASRSGCPH